MTPTNREPVSAELRQQVWNKTDPPGHCWYCGISLFTDSGWPNSFCVEHGTSRFKGGSNDLDNLRPSCWSCNSKKGTYRRYEEFREDVRAALKEAAELLRKYAGVKVKFDPKEWTFFGERNV